MTDIAHKAERARALLSDELLQDAIQTIRDRQMQAFANSAPQDVETREQAHSRLCALNEVVSEIQSLIDTHTIEQKKGRHRE